MGRHEPRGLEPPDARAGFLAALPATFDYITFYKIKKSATLHIRLDIVFSVYGMFAVAVIVRYAWHIWRLLRGDRPEKALGGGARSSGVTLGKCPDASPPSPCPATSEPR